MSDHETLAELFARDPFTLTREDIDAIIAAQREARKNFQAGVKTPKVAKEVNLAELGLL